MSQLAALRKTIRSLKRAGRITDAHAALLAIVEGMAVAVELEPTNAALWKEYRSALASLVEVAADVDSRSADVVALVRTPVVNTKNA